MPISNTVRTIQHPTATRVHYELWGVNARGVYFQIPRLYEVSYTFSSPQEAQAELDLINEWWARPRKPPFNKILIVEITSTGRIL